MFIPDPRSDPKTATKERGEEKFSCPTFFYIHKYHKIENYFIFELVKKKNMGQFTKNTQITFYPKNCQ